MVREAAFVTEAEVDVNLSIMSKLSASFEDSRSCIQ